MATEMANIDGTAFKTLNRIVPGHFTVLLKSSRMLPKILKNKREIVGLRVPDEPLALALIEQYGRPLVRRLFLKTTRVRSSPWAT